MHNGGYKTLQEVMEFYNNGGGKGLGLKVENQTLPENQKQIIASQYELYLPSEQQLLEEVNKELESFGEKG